MKKLFHNLKIRFKLAYWYRFKMDCEESLFIQAPPSCMTYVKLIRLADIKIISLRKQLK